MNRVLGVLAGADMPTALLAEWAGSADLVLAADGGLDRLLEAGLAPHHMVGDMDSTENARRLEYLAHDTPFVLHRNADPNTTDCDKLLDLARKIGVESITLAGVEGDLLDHTLATIQSALKSGLDVRLALRRGVAWVLSGPKSVAVATVPGRRVSLIPLGELSEVDLGGVEWPLSGASMGPRGLTSVSNRATAKRVSVRVGSGDALLFVERTEEETPSW
ncbi:MAG: thiamine diphosphokinase [Fimbriimonadaceae bacterium]